MSNYPEDLSLILAREVSQMTFPMVITDMVVNPDLTISLEVCDLYHAEPGRIVTIGGNDYTIISIDDTTSTMVLSAGPAIVVSTFDLYGIFFFQGTPIDVEKQIKDIPNAVNKTPMVFLLIPYNEHTFDDLNDPRSRDAKVSLFCLTQANFEQWSTGNFMDNAVRPMKRLQWNLKNKLKADTEVFQFVGKEYDVVPRVKFGVYISNKGVQKGFAAMDLSGVQWDVTLTILKPCGSDECPLP